MSFYVFRGYDAEGVAEVRERLRPAHREHLRSVRYGVEAVAGGMLKDEQDTHVIGSLLVLRAQDRHAVEQYVASDPYTDGHVFARTEIERWDLGFGLGVTPSGVASGEKVGAFNADYGG